jgi:hypothetical protein
MLFIFHLHKEQSFFEKQGYIHDKWEYRLCRVVEIDLMHNMNLLTLAMPIHGTVTNAQQSSHMPQLNWIHEPGLFSYYGLVLTPPPSLACIPHGSNMVSLPDTYVLYIYFFKRRKLVT